MDAQLDPEVMAMIAREATRPRFVLVFAGGYMISAETIGDFNKMATECYLGGRESIASYYGVPFKPVLDGRMFLLKKEAEVSAVTAEAPAAADEAVPRG